MAEEILIKGGSVLTPEGMVGTDVLVSDRVLAMGDGLTADKVIDASGCWVGPGLVDIHVHFREPGQEWKEDIASGSAAAAAGGFTAVLAMPNTDPAIDSGHLARFVGDRGRDAGLVEVIPVGALTMGRKGEHLSHLDDLWVAGVRVFSDDGDTVADAGLLRSAMEYLAHRGGLVAQHAEDPGLARGGHMHEGAVSSRLGMRALPSVAEEVVVARDLALVRLTGCRYHVQHVSTAGTVDLVRAAKAEGLPVTAEVAPHHLTFSDQKVLSMDPDFKMYPPLRAESDIEALRAALIDGTIDAVATDHAPHAAAESEVPFEEAPRGVIGLETAVSAVLMATGMGPRDLFDRMSIRPAFIAGLPNHGRPVEVGGTANLTVIDPSASWLAGPFRSKSQNSPWKGSVMTGAIVATILAGHITHTTSAEVRS
ncbi:MAG: dihydroorotase [Acidimicrobiia bacterium]